MSEVASVELEQIVAMTMFVPWPPLAPSMVGKGDIGSHVLAFAIGDFVDSAFLNIA
jgi:hypothetical protein